MDQYRTEKAVYTPTDLVTFRENGTLDITPKFQRRAVWRTPAKSYFIDTMLRGMTVPPLYFRLMQDKETKKTVRQVVDGQQRVRSVLEFMVGGYRLSKNLKASWAGNKFDQLKEEQQQQIRDFSFSTEIFKGITDAQILEVFCRLNINGVGLNRQELRNGKFFGLFKQTSYDLALAYLEFWRKHGIFTEVSIARMLEVELSSELLIAGSEGMQDKKTSIDFFYEKWEKEYLHSARDADRFKEVMNTISEAFPEDELRTTQFRRSPLFYTLYCVVFHHIFGLPSIQRATPRKHLTSVQRDDLRDAAALLSEKINESKDPNIDLAAKYKTFVAACQRQTDNIGPRKVRFNSLYDAAF